VVCCTGDGGGFFLGCVRRLNGGVLEKEAYIVQLFCSVRICTDIQQEPRLCTPY